MVLAFVNDEKVVKKIFEHLADLVEPSREGKFLRYRARSDSLRAWIDFLYAECCTQSKAVAGAAYNLMRMARLLAAAPA